MTFDEDDEPTLDELIAGFVAADREELHTALPARVERYDAAAQVADVRPVLSRRIARADGSVVTELMPTIRAVPVVWPRTGQWFVHMPLAEGDTVLLVVLERDPTRWRITGEASDPLDLRHHHLSHAVAVPGLFPRRAALSSLNTPSDALVLGHASGAQVRVKGDGTVELAGATALALGPNVEQHLSAIAQDLAAIAAAASTTATNYSPAAKAALDASNPISATKTRGA